MLRRKFLQTSTLFGLSGGYAFSKPRPTPDRNGHRVRLSLNAYSFNRALSQDSMSLDELLDFAAKTGFQGLDLTAYYIPGYPEVPSDEVLYGIKKKAFRHGLALSGTGVRNDFTHSEPEKREESLELVKQWVRAAAKMGIPHVRVFDGRQSPGAYSRAEVKGWVRDAFQECADFASQQGVMIAYQNHNDFLIGTEEIIALLTSVDSEWFGLMLDIGSLPAADPYAEIEKLIPYAITWQIKENVSTPGGSVPTDFTKLMKLVKEKGYQGYFPLETLGEGDPYKKVKNLYQKVSTKL